MRAIDYNPTQLAQARLTLEHIPGAEELNLESKTTYDDGWAHSIKSVPAEPVSSNGEMEEYDVSFLARHLPEDTMEYLFEHATFDDHGEHVDLDSQDVETAYNHADTALKKRQRREKLLSGLGVGKGTPSPYDIVTTPVVETDLVVESDEFDAYVRDLDEEIGDYTVAASEPRVLL